jgi:hypothetical protein
LRFFGELLPSRGPDAPDEPAFVAALEAFVAEHELLLVRFGRREEE